MRAHSSKQRSLELTGVSNKRWLEYTRFAAPVTAAKLRSFIVDDTGWMSGASASKILMANILQSALGRYCPVEMTPDVRG